VVSGDDLGWELIIDADWPLIGGSFTINGIHVEWPKKTNARLTGPGPLNESQTRGTENSPTPSLARNDGPGRVSVRVSA